MITLEGNIPLKANTFRIDCQELGTEKEKPVNRSGNHVSQYNNRSQTLGVITLDAT